MNTTTEIRDQIQPLTSEELESVAGAGMMHVGFSFGCLRYDIVATENQYMVIQTSCECR